MSKEVMKMKIGVISDLHGSFDDVKNALDRLKNENVDIVICAGDLLYNGPRNPIPQSYNPGGVADLLNNFGKRMIIVRGNCDAEVDQLAIKYPILGDTAYFYADGIFIVITHGHRVESFEKFGKENGADIVISGHTHIPVMENFDWGVHLNPGSVTFPKGGSKKSYAIIDIANGEYKIKIKEI